MGVVGAYEAKTHLSELLERVARGERVTITKHGVPVAVLQAPDSREKAPPRVVIEQLRAFRRRKTLKGVKLREMIDEGRR